MVSCFGKSALTDARFLSARRSPGEPFDPLALIIRGHTALVILDFRGARFRTKRILTKATTLRGGSDAHADRIVGFDRRARSRGLANFTDGRVVALTRSLTKPAYRDRVILGYEGGLLTNLTNKDTMSFTFATTTLLSKTISG